MAAQVMKDIILNDWNIVRIIRLILALVIVVNSIQHKDWLFLALGAYFLYLAVFNIKCSTCANGNCEIPTDKKKA